MSKRIKKINQLDSLRSIAAFSVIFFHFLPDYNLGGLPFGWIGVDLFFVISGYLITAILLEQKDVINRKFLIIKNFIIKRALRLFPIYYLFISFFLFLMYAFRIWMCDKGDVVYYLTYTQNILFFKEGMRSVQTNHLWTLAVEEQFYLFWPWLVVLVSNKNLIRSLIIVIPVTLFFLSVSEIENLRMLTIYHFDTLGAGALIALFIKEKGDLLGLFTHKIKAIIILSSLSILVIGSFYNMSNFPIFLSILALSTSLVIGCYHNFTGVIGNILNLSQLQYLGKISYGLYLYHKPIPFLAKLFMNKAQIQVNNLILLVSSIALTILIAHLSYHLIEKRFLNLKEKFDL